MKRSKAELKQIQEMLSLFLKSIGFNTMANDVLKETENKRLQTYARVIVDDLSKNNPTKVWDVRSKFLMLRLL